MHCCQSFQWGLDNLLGKKHHRGFSWQKWLFNFTAEKRRNFLGCCTFHNFRRWKLATAKRALSVFLLSFEAKVVLSITHPWGETAIQDNKKLIYRWETKRFALLTSCWLPVELHFVVSFGFVVACHQVALGWWIHFQGNYIRTFRQWHLPNAWKQ